MNFVVWAQYIVATVSAAFYSLSCNDKFVTTVIMFGNITFLAHETCCHWNDTCKHFYKSNLCKDMTFGINFLSVFEAFIFCHVYNNYPTHESSGSFGGTEDLIKVCGPYYVSRYPVVVSAVVTKCDIFCILSVCSKSNTEGGSFRVFAVRQWDFISPKTNRVTSASLEEQEVPAGWIPWLFICLCAFSGNQTSEQTLLFLVYKTIATSQGFCSLMDFYFFSQLLTSDMFIS